LRPSGKDNRVVWSGLESNRRDLISIFFQA
jgi:hypothetical protein